MTKTTELWSYSNFSVSALKNACVDIGNLKLVDEFVAVVDAIEEPYTRADITAVKEAYGKVPSSLVSSIDSEIIAKYNAILASVGPDEATEVPSLEGMPKTDVKYPKNATKKEVTKSIGDIEDFILSSAGIFKEDVPTLVTQSLYTNAVVGKIAGFLCPVISGLDKMIAKMPADLANSLKDEEKFAGAVEVLNTIDTSDGLDSWKKVEFKNGDMGFQDGDREGFLDACAALFRPYSLLTLVISFENSINTTNGTYTYNAYEKLVPILEALDLRGVVSSHDYTLVVNAAEDTNAKMDARFRQILVPIVNLIDDISKDPFNGILDFLPKLGYALDTGLVNDKLHEITNHLGFGVKVGEYDLTSAGLYDILAPMLENIEVGGAKYSVALDKDKFVKLLADLSGCGEYVLKDSVARGQLKHISIDSDKTDAYMVLFDWLHGEITSDDNLNTITSIINGLEISDIIKVVLHTFVTIFSYSSPEDVISVVSHSVFKVSFLFTIIRLLKVLIDLIKMLFGLGA